MDNMGLFAFIIFFIDTDGPRVPCFPFMVTNFALPYASWAFASLIIVLRVIAIWNHNIVVSLLSFGVWAGGLALNIRNLTMVQPAYNPLVNACIVVNTHEGLVNSIAVLAADIVLLLTMLIGLLRHANKNPSGVWNLLYQQCIVWILLAATAEIPTVVFLILDLNDVWNEMFTGPALTILSIAASRMYRSLSKHGSITESVSVSSSLPQFSTGVSAPASAQFRRTNTFGPISFASATQTGSTRSAHEAPVFLPADQVLQVEFVPNMSDSSIWHENRAGEATFKKV
ncbi:hypothetical protein BJV77DRAFT_372733 [Russula vinacea]|nr:hypothetical protein BJV77DRAFT_372733 [Russula vinacea]